MHISSTVDTFYEQHFFYLFVNQIRLKSQLKTQLRKMLHDISEHNISYLQSLLFVIDIVELHITDVVTEEVKLRDMQDRNINEGLFS